MENQYDALNEKLKELKDNLATINQTYFQNEIDKIEYLTVSYDSDKNPNGIVSYASELIEKLKETKEKKGFKRKITKKMITALEKAYHSIADTISA